MQDCDPDIFALVDRQARAWETGDFASLARDWREDGVLTAPGAVIPFPELRRAFDEFQAGYGDLQVAIRNVFHTADRRKVAIEWGWTVSRRSDGRRSTTQDAIIVDLEDGRIRCWREFFDTAGAVERSG